MAAAVDQIQGFRLTIPAGTAIATPETFELQLGIFTVEWIELDVPSGWNGDVGFYIASSNSQVFPYRVGAVPNWLVLSGTSKHWDLQNQANSGDYQLVAYNVGNFDHNLQVTFGLTVIADTGVQLLNAVPTVIPVDQLSG